MEGIKLTEDYFKAEAYDAICAIIIDNYENSNDTKMQRIIGIIQATNINLEISKNS